MCVSLALPAPGPLERVSIFVESCSEADLPVDVDCAAREDPWVPLRVLPAAPPAPGVVVVSEAAVWDEDKRRFGEDEDERKDDKRRHPQQMNGLGRNAIRRAMKRAEVGGDRASRSVCRF